MAIKVNSTAPNTLDLVNRSIKKKRLRLILKLMNGIAYVTLHKLRKGNNTKSDEYHNQFDK